ncbi:MAG: hypothetical protein V2I43_26660 [Parvularcula sp.]|jgi:hypothetical protein|nr:hypothetical protein [Parvularcula sp.]
MKLSEIITTVTGHLLADTFLDGLEVIANIEADHNRRLETALKDKGLALVVVQSAGVQAKSTSPHLLLETEVVISVLENAATNQTGKGALEVTEHVLKALHQVTWATERGLRNVLQVDTPAYEAGPLDAGLIIYFCNFRILSLQ